MEKQIELRLMHWVYVDGVKFFGPGRVQLLRLIQETGSIAQAAKSMGMSYKKAWRMVDEMNTFGRSPYVIAHKGGQLGGGTEITERGKLVIEAYSDLNKKLLSLIEEEKELLKLI
jgi:molybdate transport system regulatory protein